MRILVAVNKQPYSDNMVTQVAELAINTWSDVTLLATEDRTSSAKLRTGALSGKPADDKSMVNVLDRYRSRFVRLIGDKDSPYAIKESEYHLGQDEKENLTLIYDGQNGRKNLKARVRFGNCVKEILAESIEEDMDLILIACGESNQCEWPGRINVPQKVSQDAKCSVFIVKEEKRPEKIVCCLDKDTVSQASLELINQLVTLYKAELEIVGLTTSDDLKTGVDYRMAEILNYYHERQIRAWVKLVESGHFKSFISEAARNNLVALWMGENSFLDKLLSKKLLENFVETAESSVLILR